MGLQIVSEDTGLKIIGFIIHQNSLIHSSHVHNILFTNFSIHKNTIYIFQFIFYFVNIFFLNHKYSL